MNKYRIWRMCGFTEARDGEVVEAETVESAIAKYADLHSEYNLQGSFELYVRDLTTDKIVQGAAHPTWTCTSVEDLYEWDTLESIGATT